MSAARGKNAAGLPAHRSCSDRASVSQGDRQPVGGTQTRVRAAGTVGVRDVLGDGGLCRFDYLLVESTGVSEPLPAAETRVGRRTALTFPLLPPPQKN
jgi:hypothetical protein